jgi:hypothetical protein
VIVSAETALAKFQASSHRPLVAALPFYRGDIEQAFRWLQWANFLSRQPGGDVSRHLLLIFHRSGISPKLLAGIRNLQLSQPPFFLTGWVSDMAEDSQQAIAHVLQWVEHNLPGHATLCCNPDTCPIRPPWFDEIADEYAGSPEPFMGDFIEGRWHENCNDHMPNDGSVYAANWRALAPSILRDAVDTQIAEDVLKYFHHANTLQQVWQADPWTEDNLKRLRPGTALVHQCKDGTLQALLRKRFA